MGGVSRDRAKGKERVIVVCLMRLVSASTTIRSEHSTLKVTISEDGDAIY